MQVTKPGYFTNLISKIKRIKVWHKKFRHTNNAKIIKISKLLIKIMSFKNTYDFITIYGNSE